MPSVAQTLSSVLRDFQMLRQRTRKSDCATGIVTYNRDDEFSTFIALAG